MKIDSSKHGVVVDTVTNLDLTSDLGLGANKHGLVVSNLIDVTDEGFITKLNALRQQGVTLSLLHVLKNVPSSYYQIPSFLQIMQAWDNRDRAQLQQLAQALAIPESRCWIVRGYLDEQIDRCVEQYHLDFVIAKAPVKKGLFASLVDHIPHVLHSQAHHPVVNICS